MPKVLCVLAWLLHDRPRGYRPTGGTSQAHPPRPPSGPGGGSLRLIDVEGT